MAGRGPAPKDPRRRARRNADSAATTVIKFERGPQPDLPQFDVQIEENGELTSRSFRWPEQTRTWWKMWADSPLSVHFMASDWEFLLDTALLHAQLWSGDHRVSGELRLRVAKFGATPEDRARLRIQFAEADDADGGQSRTGGQSARDRRGPLHLVPPAASE